MPNSVKYSTTTPLNSLRKGNVAIGVNDVDMGPTTSTGWYNGVTPSGNYPIIYKTTSTGDPDIFAPQSDQELYNFVIMQGGNSSNTTSVGAALAWIATQSDLLATYNVLPNIVTDGLVLALNAGDVSSYPTTGNTWYDLSGQGSNGALTNGPIFNSGSYIEFDGVDDYINGQDSVPLGNPCTVMALINCNSGGSGAGVVFGSSANGSDNWFEINNTSVQLFATRIADSDNFTLAGGTLLCDGTRWYKVAMTINGDTAKIYLNGVEVNSITKAFTIASWTGTFDIGRRGKVSQRYFKGSISNVIGYNKSLSEDELRQNYYQAPIVTDGLVLAVDAGNLVSYESGSTTTYPYNWFCKWDFNNGVKYNSNNGGHWEFDGVDDYITWGDNFDLVSSNISGFVWGKVNTLDDYTPWIDKLSGGGNYRFHSDVIGRLVLGIRDSNNAYQQTITTSVLSIDTWYNIGFTFNNSTREGKIYLNGRLIHSNTFTIDRGDTTTPLQTGYQSNNGGTLNGALATLSLYNKALTASEVLQNYNAQKSRF
jgi:hypothetical protein